MWLLRSHVWKYESTLSNIDCALKRTGGVEIKKRNSYWQIVRGICIIAVIMIHCPNALAYSRESIDYKSWIVLRQILDFPVPVFIFMAGYFARKDKCLEAPLRYLKSRGGVLLIPYILWTLLYSAVSLLRSREWCGAIPFLLKNLLTGKAASPLYYIVLLLQLELLLPVLIKLLRRGGLARGILWMITPLYMVYVYIHCFIWGQHPPLYGTLFPAYLIFYLTGLEASCRKEYLVRAGRRYGKAVWIVITLGVSIVEGTILSRAGIPRMAVSQLKCSSFLYSGTIILFLLNHYESREKATKNPYHSILNIVGNDSYGIFYLHCLILKIEIAVGKRIAVTVPWFVTVLLYCSITVLICEGVIYCVRHIAKITYIYTSKYTCNNKCKHKRKYIGEGYLKYIGF